MAFGAIKTMITVLFVSFRVAPKRRFLGELQCVRHFMAWFPEFLCYLETQTLVTHPWELVPKGIAYFWWQAKLAAMQQTTGLERVVHRRL